MAGKLRPNLNIIFWAGMLSTRTQCGQAIQVKTGRKKGKAFPSGNLAKSSRKTMFVLDRLKKKYR